MVELIETFKRYELLVNSIHNLHHKYTVSTSLEYNSKEGYSCKVSLSVQRKDMDDLVLFTYKFVVPFKGE